MLRTILRKSPSLKPDYWDFARVELEAYADRLDAERVTKRHFLSLRERNKIRCFPEFLYLYLDDYASFAYFVDMFGVVGLFPYERSERLQKQLGWDGEKFKEPLPKVSSDDLEEFRKEVAPELKRRQLEMKEVVEAWRQESAMDSRENEAARRRTYDSISNYLKEISILPAFQVDTLADSSPTVGVALQTKSLLAVCYLEIWNFIQGIEKLAKCRFCHKFFSADLRGNPKYCPRCRKDGYEMARQKKFGPDYKREYQKMAKRKERVWDKYGEESSQYKQACEELDRWLLEKGARPRKRKSEL